MKRLPRLRGYLKFVGRPLEAVNKVADSAGLVAVAAAITVPPAFSDWVRSDWRWAALIGWVVLGLLIVASARMYRALHPAFDIEFTKAWADEEGGHTFVVRAEILNKGPTSTFEAEIARLDGLQHRPTTHIPLGWAPDDKEALMLDEGGPARSLIVGFAHTLAGAMESLPGEEPRRPSYGFDFTPYPGTPRRRPLLAGKRTIFADIVVRDQQSRASKTRRIRIQVSPDDLSVDVVPEGDS